MKVLLCSALAVASTLSFTTSAFASNQIDHEIAPEVVVGVDVTSSFTTTMRQNAAYMAYYAMMDQDQGTYPLLTGEEFASKVRTGGPWDYKQFYGSGVRYTYNGIHLYGADLGNMHYGFAGRGAGFSDTLLKSAAGAYQIYSGTSYYGWYRSYFDDPQDQYWINYGISMFNNNSWPSALNIGSNSLVDYTSLLSEEEKKEIENKVKNAAKKINK